MVDLDQNMFDLIDLLNNKNQDYQKDLKTIKKKNEQSCFFPK